MMRAEGSWAEDGENLAMASGKRTGVMRTAVMIVALFALAACGGGDRNARNYGGNARVAVAAGSGPIYSACMRSGRKAANPRLCACVQGAANSALSSAEQREAAGFYNDPHQAQVVRQSDNPRHEVFWQRYKTYAGRAEQLCTGL